MTLDPSMKQILEYINSLELPDFEKADISELRNMEKQSFQAGNVEDVSSTKEYEIEINDHSLKMRLYKIDDRSRSLIIYLHGGGFVFGSIDLSDSVARHAANISRSNVLSVDYRLAPENKFPAAVNDAYDAFLWTHNNSEELGIDRARIAIAGDSAGGNLAAASILKLTDEGKPLPALQILFYPVLGPDVSSESYREFSDGYLLNDRHMDFFAKSYMNRMEDVFNPYFSPLLHPNLKGLPETIVITAEYDPLRDQGETFVSRLRKSGVEATGFRALGLIHGFINYTGISMAAENTVNMIWSLAGAKLKA